MITAKGAKRLTEEACDTRVLYLLGMADTSIKVAASKGYDYCYVHSNKYNKVFKEHMVKLGFAVTFFGDYYKIMW